MGQEKYPLTLSDVLQFSFNYHKYVGTILVDFNVGIFDIFAISHTLNLILMSGFDNM
jgi:hypothetical protein